MRSGALTPRHTRAEFLWAARRSTLQKSAADSRSSCCTAGLISTWAICYPTWIGGPTRSGSSTTTSADAVKARTMCGPEDVTLKSELADLDAVRQHFRVESPALLGHSWGAVLALEYALRYPTRVSHISFPHLR